MLTDADIVKIEDEHLGIPVHEGFHSAAVELHDSIAPIITAYPDYTVHLTGHSLGGAIAAITMMRLKSARIKVGWTITFGQPKVTTLDGGNNNDGRITFSL